MKEIAFSELKDKVITNCTLSENSHELNFYTKDEHFIFEVEGDCCSSSWIESVDLETLKGSTLLDIEGIEMESEWIYADSYKTENDHEEHDCLKYYSIKLKTSKGYVDIEFRNASNGYYGASCKLYKVTA